MAQPVFYQTLNGIGIDVTMYYTNLTTAGGSISPELPAPPFSVGTRALGSDNSEFLFVQASTQINLGDFVVISAGSSTSPAFGSNAFLANSITTTNASNQQNIELGLTGLVLKQSVTTIPAGAMFWACVKGCFIPGYASNSTPGGCQVQSTGTGLYTTSTAGALTNITGATSAAQFLGITVISSLSVSIPASVVPPVGTLTSSGFAQGPIFSLNKVRSTPIMSSLSVPPVGLTISW